MNQSINEINEINQYYESMSQINHFGISIHSIRSFWQKDMHSRGPQFEKSFHQSNQSNQSNKKKRYRKTNKQHNSSSTILITHMTDDGRRTMGR
mmetsp:Transcript_24107/g.30340  ORF Transcript_24107/g.30340 Transcript_24107/m.30340 type:complete len:94 (+) Transcript_24107:32-313(+)